MGHTLKTQITHLKCKGRITRKEYDELMQLEYKLHKHSWADGYKAALTRMSDLIDIVRWDCESDQVIANNILIAVQDSDDVQKEWKMTDKELYQRYVRDYERSHADDEELQSEQDFMDELADLRDDDYWEDEDGLE